MGSNGECAEAAHVVIYPAADNPLRWALENGALLTQLQTFLKGSLSGQSEIWIGSEKFQPDGTQIPAFAQCE